MTSNKTFRAVFLRNALVFLIVYVVMMGTITYVTADRTRKRMKEKSYAITEELNAIMLESWPGEGPPSPTVQLYIRMGNVMSGAVSENLYLRAELYDGTKQLLAKTGNVVIIDKQRYDENGLPTGAWDIGQTYLLLDDYMKTDEINAFFAPRGLDHLLHLQITGHDGAAGVVPQKMELFKYPASWSEPNPVLSEKTFSATSDDAVAFSFERHFKVYFEHIKGSGAITKTDIRRYDNCTKTAALALELAQTGRFYGGGPEGNMFHEKYYTSRTAAPFGISGVDDRMMVFGIEYYPLEVTMSQLVPVYVLSLLFIVVLMCFLSLKLKGIFDKQALLECNRRDLTNAIAHELKTPLGIIRNYSEGLKERINEDKRDDYLDVIIRETEHMDGMVLDMLGLSALDAGLALNLQPHSLPRLAEDTLARYRDMIAAKGVTATVQATGDCTIMCDKKQMEQVMSNFLSNAVRHVPQGGDIRIAITRALGKVTFSIQNNGAPIPPDKLPEIWTAYYKADAARSNPRGTGLGLSIVKGILQAHGFGYGVENVADGVRFWFVARV